MKIPAPPPGATFADPNVGNDQTPPPPPGSTLADSADAQPQQNTLDWLATQAGVLAPPHGKATMGQRFLGSGLGNALYGEVFQPITGLAQGLVNSQPEMLRPDESGMKAREGARMINQWLSQADATYQGARKATGQTGFDWGNLVGNVLSGGLIGGGEGDVAVAGNVARKLPFLQRVLRAGATGTGFGAAAPTYLDPKSQQFTETQQNYAADPNDLRSGVPLSQWAFGPSAPSQTPTTPGNQTTSPEAAYRAAKAQQAVTGLVLGGGLHLGGEATTGALNLAGTVGTSVENQTAKYIQRLADLTGVSPQDILDKAKEYAGRGMTGAEAMGNTAINHLMTLGRRAGDTGDQLLDTLGLRAQQAPSRVLTTFSNLTGIDPTAARGNIDSIVKAGRAAASDWYNKAFAGGSTAPLLPHLQTGFQDSSDRVAAAQNALKAAQTKATGVAGKYLPGDNVYGESSRIVEQKAAQAGIDQAQAALDKAQADHEQILGQLGQAHADQAAGVKGGMWTPHLQQLLNNPRVKMGLKEGFNLERDQADAAGVPFNPYEWGVRTDADGNFGDVTRVPNMRTIDMAKRGLDSLIDATKDDYGRINWSDPRVEGYNNLRTSLLDITKTLNPDYEKALGVSSDYLGVRQAFMDGQDRLFDENFSAKDFNKWFNGDPANEASKGLNPAQQDGVRSGMANELFNLEQKGRLTAAPTFRKALTPLVRQKLTTALGPDKADAFLNGITREGELAKSGARLMPRTNSPTGEIINTTKEQDQGYNMVPQIINWAHAWHSLPNPLPLLAMTGKALPNTFRSGGMPVNVRNAAGSLLGGTPEDLAAYLGKIQGAGRLNVPMGLAPGGGFAGGSLLQPWQPPQQ